MYEGGRLAIADDFGEGVAARRLPHHAQRAGRTDDTRRLRGNRNVLIATPSVRHPLALDVLALVTNHPQVLHHDALEAIFSLSTTRASAVVLAGAVGQGRLVAIGDSSVLINNMLEFSGNRAFARNLVRYLARERAAVDRRAAQPSSWAATAAVAVAIRSRAARRRSRDSRRCGCRRRRCARAPR